MDQVKREMEMEDHALKSSENEENGLMLFKDDGIGEVRVTVPDFNIWDLPKAPL